MPLLPGFKKTISIGNSVIDLSVEKSGVGEIYESAVEVKDKEISEEKGLKKIAYAARGIQILEKNTE